MIEKYFSNEEIGIICLLSKKDSATVSDIVKELNISPEICNLCLQNLVDMGWLSKLQYSAGELIRLNQNMLIVKRFLDFDRFLYNIPPHVDILRKHIAKFLQDTPKNVIKRISVVGSYGTNDFVNGVSDIDLVLIYNDDYSTNLATLKSGLAGEINGTRIEVWDMADSNFNILAMDGRFFPLWLLNAGLTLYSDGSNLTKIGVLKREQLKLDIERDFMAFGNKLAVIESQLELFNTFVNLSKRSSIVFNAYINNHFYRDGYLSAVDMELANEYTKIIQAKANLRIFPSLSPFDLIDIFKDFNSHLYAKYLTGPEIDWIKRRIKSIDFNNWGKNHELIEQGYEVFYSFFEI